MVESYPVCHGPAALVNVRLSNGEFLISGKQVTGFYKRRRKCGRT